MSTRECRKEIDGYKRYFRKIVSTWLGNLRRLKSLRRVLVFWLCIWVEEGSIHPYMSMWGVCVTWKGDESEYTDFEVECSGVDAHQVSQH